MSEQLNVLRTLAGVSPAVPKEGFPDDRAAGDEPAADAALRDRFWNRARTSGPALGTPGKTWAHTVDTVTPQIYIPDIVR